jgi:hypothetical protein
MTGNGWSVSGGAYAVGVGESGSFQKPFPENVNTVDVGAMVPGFSAGYVRGTTLYSHDSGWNFRPW